MGQIHDLALQERALALMEEAGAAEVAPLDPAVLDAVTATRTVLPTSKIVSVYVCDVSPKISEQLAPF